MRRPVRYSLIAALAVLIVGAAGGAAWLGGTAGGARWLLAVLSRHTPLAISARTVEGRLLGDLSLGGVRLALGPVEAEVEHLGLRWQPQRLLAGSIAVKELILAGVAIRDNTPPGRPPDLAWPRVSPVAALIDGTVGRLEVSGLTYRLADGREWALHHFSTSLVWDDSFLSLPDLAVQVPSGRVSGSVAVGFLLPTLLMEIAFTPAGDIAGMDGFTLKARLLPGQGSEQLAGKFDAAGASGTARRWGLAGEAGMTRDAFHLRKLRLTRPGLRGVVSGEATMKPTAGEPLLALQLTAAGIDLARETGVAADLSGTLTLTGTPGRYRGTFAIHTRGKEWRTAHLAGTYEGDGGGAKLTPLNGTLLGGTLRGNLTVRWRNDLSLEGTIRGRNLNPARISPDWAGAVNFDLAGNLHRTEGAPLAGKVSGVLRESRLHGQVLTGEVTAAFSGDDLNIRRLSLRGKGFALSASGRLRERLTFNAEVGDLGRVVPRASGELAADGWMRRQGGRFEVSLNARGAKLAADGLRIASGRVAVWFGEGEGFPLHVAAALHDAAYEGFQADSITLEADGTTLKHTLNAELRVPRAEVRIGVAGAYKKGVWRGRIVRLSGHDRIGPWRLAAPAELAVAAGRVTLAPLVVAGTPPERIEVSAEFAREPAGRSIRALWDGLNLARLNPWLAGVRVAGSSAGDCRLRFPADGPPQFMGSASARGTLTAEKYGINLEEGRLSLDAGARGLRAGLEFRTAGGGTLKGGVTFPGPLRLAHPETGEITAEWEGIDVALFRRWFPGGAGLDGRLAGRVAGKLLADKRLDITGGLTLAGGNVRWQKEGLALSADLQRAELAWGWQGALPATAAQISAGRITVAGRIGASGVLTLEGRRISIEQASLSLDGNDRGLSAGLEFSLAEGGSLKGRFASPRPAGLGLPTEGAVGLEWTGIDAVLFDPWLPAAVRLEGRLAGRVAGDLLPEGRFSLTGDASLAGGAIRWRRPEGEMNAALRSASLSWDWRGEALRGDAALTLTDYGKVDGSFALPLAARFPVAPNGTGVLRAAFKAHLKEQGLLSALFPGLIRESRGEIDAGLQVGGTWEASEIRGSLALAGAGAFLPSAGVQVSDLRLTARLEDGQIHIDSFRAVSGPGWVEGTALVRLKGWQVADYEGSVTGERFRTVYLPELQILSTPRLTFEGTPERLAIRGEVLVPELIINGPPTREVVLPSRDVILEGAPKPSEKTSPLVFDVQVRLTLGERVLVKAEGIDAQMGGSVDLTFQHLDKITSKGEIKVVKGRYKAYGVDLEIVRGRLFYAGGPINQPALDILALRTVGDVRAGITAGGLLRAPVIKLYAEPSMPDVDILSYILFGYPFSSGNTAEQAGMMAQAAGALLSRGQSALLQDQIKDRLGLSTLGLQTGESPGLMGYKPMPTTPAGQTQTAGSVSQTMVTVGKYLTPRLYFSYGRSLFTGGNLFRLRYDIFRQWQIETQTGSASGVDLYYKIEFN